MDKRKLWQQKTTWAAISSVIGAVGGVVTGVLPVAAAAQIVVTAVISIFLRQGVENLK